MRSSKSRSRSKNNRNRSMGNIVNRVFDSSGPEGKVRGTPQQIIDKYNQLARDAQLGNDRVAAENFQQHSEHYTRLLSEAQREQNERREQQEREQEARRERDDRDRSDRQDDDENSNEASNQGGGNQGDGNQGGGDNRKRRGGGGGDRSDVIDVQGEDTGLVETPESAPKPRRGRKPKGGGDQDGSASPAEAAE